MKNILYFAAFLLIAACNSKGIEIEEKTNYGIRLDSVLSDTMIGGMKFYERLIAGDSVKFKSKDKDKIVYAYINGIRTCHPSLVRNEKSYLGFDEIQKDTTSYNLMFIICCKDYFFIEEGATALMRLKNDSIYEFKHEHRTIAYKEKGLYKLHCGFGIDESVIEELQKEMVKIRFMLKGEPYDIELEEDNVTSILKEEYKLIWNRMNNIQNKEGF